MALLLRNEALEEAEYWAADHQDELISIERDFLAACQEARTIAERERRQALRIRWLGVISTIIGVIAVIASAVAYYQQVETEKGKNRNCNWNRSAIHNLFSMRSDATGACLYAGSYG